MTRRSDIRYTVRQRERAHEVNAALAKAHPDARCELDYTTPLELLAATVLSAQSTDVRVNQVTPALFGRYKTALDYAEASQPDVEDLIRTVGFQRQKARSLIGIGQELITRHDGEVPADLDELVALPGVGRKTANVVLGNAFGIPGITVDTHVGRLSRRLGWTESKDPVTIERELGELFPPEDWTMLCHRLIFHGRRICHSRRPACGECPITALCPSAEVPA